MNRSKRLLRLFGIYWAYSIKRSVRLSYMPYRLWIEPTSHCNLKCRMCPNKSLDNDQLGLMEFELYKKIIDESCHFVHDINLHHRGESLLHPKIFEMIEYAKTKDVVVRLHTNASVLNNKKGLELIGSGIDLVSFSFDGIDKETYEGYRIGAQFEETLNNISDFLLLKKRLNKKQPFTVLELIDFSNIDGDYKLDRLSYFMDQFRGLPLNRVIVKKPHNFAGSVNISVDEADSHYSPCTFLWHSLIIFWNGDILPCTQDFYGELSLGNIKDMSLKEAFNSQAIVSLREKALSGDLMHVSPCADCNMIRRKMLFRVPVDSFRYLG